MLNKTDIYKISDDKLDVLSSDFIDKLRTNLIPHEITFEEQYRVDIIASNLYKDYSKYWIIQAVNDIKDVTKLAAGNIIYYPSNLDIILKNKLK